jgi:hypothetical protein
MDFERFNYIEELGDKAVTDDFHDQFTNRINPLLTKVDLIIIQPTFTKLLGYQNTTEVLICREKRVTALI